jgi:hypothetical protein
VDTFFAAYAFFLINLGNRGSYGNHALIEELDHLRCSRACMGN